MDKTDADLAKPSSAEPEENSSSQKIDVKVRARATKPETTGDEATQEISTKTEDADKRPDLTAPPKANTVTPDITSEEAKTEDPEEPEGVKSDDGAAIEELAKEASDKKASKHKDGERGSPADNKVQALIDNKTYFVPIGQVTKRRNTKIFVAILLVIVAACLGAYFMMVG